MAAGAYWLGPAATLNGVALLRRSVGVCCWDPSSVSSMGESGVSGWQEIASTRGRGRDAVCLFLSGIGSSTPMLIGSALASIVGLVLLFLAGLTVRGEHQLWS